MLLLHIFISLILLETLSAQSLMGTNASMVAFIPNLSFYSNSTQRSVLLEKLLVTRPIEVVANTSLITPIPAVRFYQTSTSQTVGPRKFFLHKSTSISNASHGNINLSAEERDKALNSSVVVVSAVNQALPHNELVTVTPNMQIVQTSTIRVIHDTFHQEIIANDTSDVAQSLFTLKSIGHYLHSVPFLSEYYLKTSRIFNVEFIVKANASYLNQNDIEIISKLVSVFCLFLSKSKSLLCTRLCADIVAQ